MATAAGAAGGLAQGAVAGATASRSASPSPTLAAPLANGPASAELAPASSTSPTCPSSSTTTPARPRQPKCMACWKPQFGMFKPLVHAYTGDCLQSPASVPETVVPAPPAAATPQPPQPDVQSQFGSAAAGGWRTSGRTISSEITRKWICLSGGRRRWSRSAGRATSRYIFFS